LADSPTSWTGSVVLLACLALFVIGSGLTALATDLPVLVTGRVIQGLGGGGLVPATLAIVGALWPPERRGLPLGVVGAVQELGSVLGPLLGALILAVADWRAIFWLNAAAGIILAVAVAAVGGAPLTRPRPVPTALAVLALAVTALALAAPETLVTSVSLGAALHQLRRDDGAAGDADRCAGIGALRPWPRPFCCDGCGRYCAGQTCWGRSCSGEPWGAWC
jgi:MFS family permease